MLFAISSTERKLFLCTYNNNNNNTLEKLKKKKKKSNSVTQARYKLWKKKICRIRFSDSVNQFRSFLVPIFAFIWTFFSSSVDEGEAFFLLFPADFCVLLVYSFQTFFTKLLSNYFFFFSFLGFHCRSLIFRT